jgi:hypothetical protein
VIALSLQLIVLYIDFSIARFALKIVARAALPPGFPSPAVDFRRIAPPKRPWNPSDIVRWTAHRTCHTSGTKVCDIVVGTFDRGGAM